jgi:telomere length regulation protein
MLNALALGARELASLPIPPSVTLAKQDHKYFPSKMLPTTLHRKYLAAGNHLVQHLLDEISREAINKGKEADADKVPDLVRERHLKIWKSANITEIHSSDNHLVKVHASQDKTTFADVAAEFFVVPLINRFWLFLRNEQTREARTAHQEPLYRYKGTGTGLILSNVVLSHFLRTLAILVHAAQNAPQWLAIMAPYALELAVTLGTKPISQDDIDDGSGANNGTEASVLTAALELALAVLDGCLELDSGRSLSLEHTALLLGAGEWAGAIFSQLEMGIRIEGGGGAQEVKLKRSAAGVVLKVDELTSRWRRSMVDFV